MMFVERICLVPMALLRMAGARRAASVTWCWWSPPLPPFAPSVGPAADRERP